MTPAQQQYGRVLLVWVATLAALFIIQQYFTRL